MPFEMPRVEVLAELTGLGDGAEDPPVDGVDAVVEELDGVEDPHADATTSTAATASRATIDGGRDPRAKRPAPAGRACGSHLLVAPITVAPCRPLVGHPLAPSSTGSGGLAPPERT
jgi:hypothetical protein